jgi:hypothetical protein
MRKTFMFRFWNEWSRLYREAPRLKLKNKSRTYGAVPGHHFDPNDRGQPKRFEKWHRLPRKAWELYWRHHEINVKEK